MENKSNEATPQRPDGDRVLDAAVVTMDLNKFIKQIKHEPSWKDSDRNSITVFHSDRLRHVLIGLHKGAEMKTHTYDGMVSVQVLDGHVKFAAQQLTHDLEAGHMVTIHTGIPHSVEAVKESFLLLTLAVT